MFRSLLVCLLAWSSSAMAQSFPASAGQAIAAKPARVSLTADGPWLPTPVAAKTYLTIIDDSSARPRFSVELEDARLLFHVERDALQSVITTSRAFVQPSEAAVPKDLARAVGVRTFAGMPVEVLAPERAGFVKVRSVFDDMEVTGFVAASSIGTTFRYDSAEYSAWTPNMALPKSFTLLDKPKGTAFVTVNATSPRGAMVIERKAGFALVRISSGAIGWVPAKIVTKPRPGELGEEGGEEGGVAGGAMGSMGGFSKTTLPINTPLFDRIDGTFIGVAEFFLAKPVEKKGDWTRYSLTTPYGPISVWSSSAIRAAPPKPPVLPQNVPPTLLEGSRIAGEKVLVPDDETKKKIAAAGKDKLVGSWKLCIDVTGTITKIQALKSTGFPDYDATIEAGMQKWKYKPYAVNGQAVPVCTAVTFIYSQK